MTEYTKDFIYKVIEEYKSVITNEYRISEYLDKTYIEQFEEALANISYVDKVRILDELINEAIEDVKYNL